MHTKAEDAQVGEWIVTRRHAGRVHAICRGVGYERVTVYYCDGTVETMHAADRITRYPR